jgi:hypothetical protein
MNDICQIFIYQNFLEILGVYEMLPNSIIRKAALKEALFQIRCEDENTKFLDLGPVSLLLP